MVFMTILFPLRYGTGEKNIRAKSSIFPFNALFTPKKGTMHIIVMNVMIDITYYGKHVVLNSSPCKRPSLSIRVSAHCGVVKLQ